MRQHRAGEGFGAAVGGEPGSVDSGAEGVKPEHRKGTFGTAQPAQADHRAVGQRKAHAVLTTATGLTH